MHYWTRLLSGHSARIGALCLFFLFWHQVSYTQSNVINLYNQEQSGDSTYYAESDAGNCRVSPTLGQWANDLTFQTALNNTQYISNDQSAGCGICIQGHYLGTGSGATPPPKTFTALVVDRCPECAPGDLDLALNGGDGRWDIRWRAIDCPVGDTKLSYLFEGSNPFYIKLGVRNHRIAVTKLEIQTQPNAPFVTATRKTDNFFTCKSCPFPMKFPIAVRVTGANGQILQDRILTLTNGVLLGGLNEVQFNSIDDLIFFNGFDVN